MVQSFFQQNYFYQKYEAYFHGQSFDTNKSVGRHLIGQINILLPFSVQGFSLYIIGLCLSQTFYGFERSPYGDCFPDLVHSKSKEMGLLDVIQMFNLIIHCRIYPDFFCYRGA